MGRKLPSVRRVLLFVAVAGLPFFAVLVFSAGRGHSAGPGLAPLFACPTAPGGAARCNARVLASQEAKPMVSAAPVSGYGPDQLRTAYGLVAAAGQQTTAVVAIVDAYDDPTAKSDLDTYNTTFGLPAFPTCSGSSNAGCFRKVNQTGGTSYPSTDGGWALEISLDVQTVHALCPNCGILLVEANSSNVTDLYAAEDYAAGHATVVSNSWGLSEYNGETSADGHFNHPGVAITFSTGDGGYGVQYPAASRYVTAVGGTTLNLNADNTRSSETAWDGAGSGCSAYETKPSWQTDSGCTRRTVADVSADADPNTGAAV
jgi:subtilase family serine protease